MKPKHILAVTVNRSDFGRMLPLYRALQSDPHFSFSLVATGAHFFPQYGETIVEVRQQGLPVLELPLENQEPHSYLGELRTKIGKVFEEIRPWGCIILGDRIEMLEVAQAALVSQIPLFHVGGGYITAGALDEMVRHAISKMAHIHFVANQYCAKNLRRLGESPQRIIIVGAPDLDFLPTMKWPNPRDFLSSIHLDPEQPYLLVTIHPEPRYPYFSTAVRELFNYFVELPYQLVITAPAPDPGVETVLESIKILQDRHPRAYYIPSLGYERYLWTMKFAYGVIGNSSSAIIEGSYLGVPAINIGDRQKGRELGPNVISVPWNLQSIQRALKRLTEPFFRSRATSPSNLYGTGDASAKILIVLQRLPDPFPVIKTLRETRKDLPWL